MMKKKWKKVVPIMLGSSFLCSPVMGATELTDRIYTTSMSNVITGGSYTVSNGDVLLDSSGYTGPLDGRKPVISTLNGDVNIDISEGNTLTIKGLNNRGALEADGSSLHGTITFNGGNLIVSNEANNTAENTYGLYANNGGQLDFNNDGNNKINLTVYMPGANRVQGGSAGIYVDNSLFNFDGGNLTVDIDGDRLAATSWAGISTHRGSHFIFNGEDFTVNMGSNRAEGLSRHGLRIETSRFDLDGKNFTVKLEGNPDSGLIQNQVGMFIYDGSTVDIHATEQILIESDGYALHMGKYVQYDPINTAKFEADTIIIKSRGGIHAGNHAYAEGIYDGIRNTLEFTGHMLIESIARGGNDDTYLLESNGQAISVVGTDLTFNSNRGVTVYSENLTPQGVDPYVIGYLDPNDPVPYWLRAITLRKDTQLTANTDFAVTVNGGYNNTGLYVGESQAKFNGKTSITVMNGIDTARGIFSFGGYYDRPTIAEFYDDLTISLAGTQADYIAGIEAESGGKVDIKKGLFLNDNDNIYWSLNAYDTGSQIDVNSAGTGMVQVVGDISAYDGGIINIKMNTPNSYLTATSYANDSYGGTINMNIANDAVWNMTGNSTVTSLTTDRGHVNFMAPSNSGGFKTLTVHGDYAGSGLLTMNTVLGGDDSATDKLIVEGSTTAGTTGLIVNNYNGTGEQTVNGIEIITVAGESNGVFELRNRVVGGAYEYSVTKTGKNWYLTNALIPPTPEPEPEPNPNPNPTPDPEPNPTPDPEPTPTPTPEPGGEGDAIRVIRPETGAYIANLAAANALFVTRLHDRLGETQYTDFLTGETKVTSLWLRQEGGHNRSRTQSGQGKTRLNRYVAQIGGDLAQWSNNGLDRFHLGAMASYGRVNGKTDAKYSAYSAKNKVDGYALGLYGTWYANQEDKSGLHIDSWVQYAWFDNTVQGDGLASESYDSKGWLASVEAGYSFKMGENERASYWLQPKAQLTWMGVHADAHREVNGTKVTGKGDNLSTRLGLRAYAQGHSSVDDNTGRVFQPFVEANWIYNSKNFGVTMNDVSDYQAGTRNIGEIKVGVEGHLNKKLNVWTNVAQQMGDSGYSDTQAIVGVKYSF